MNYSDKVPHIKKLLEETDAVVVGAGAGLSASAGFTYSGDRFESNFSDFIEKYGLQDMYSGGFYPFESLEEQWAFWSCKILLNRYTSPTKPVYSNLLKLLIDKNYFVITTNVDHQFQAAGFEKKRLFYTQGDYGLWQCSVPCHCKTYDNKDAVYRMVKEQRNMQIPSELVPHCPICGAPMSMNLRVDNTFVQDTGWHEAAERYQRFLHLHAQQRILFLELGVGSNTPSIIKYPFWKMTQNNPATVYVCINYGEAICPKEIVNQSICLNCNLDSFIQQVIL